MRSAIFLKRVGPPPGMSGAGGRSNTASGILRDKGCSFEQNHWTAENVAAFHANKLTTKTTRVPFTQRVINFFFPHNKRQAGVVNNKIRSIYTNQNYQISKNKDKKPKLETIEQHVLVDANFSHPRAIRLPTNTEKSNHSVMDPYNKTGRESIFSIIEKAKNRDSKIILDNESEWTKATSGKSPSLLQAINEAKKISAINRLRQIAEKVKHKNSYDKKVSISPSDNFIEGEYINNLKEVRKVQKEIWMKNKDLTHKSKLIGLVFLLCACALFGLVELVMTNQHCKYLQSMCSTIVLARVVKSKS